MKSFYKPGTVFERDPRFYQQHLTSRRSHSLSSDTQKKRSSHHHDKPDKNSKYDAMSVLSRLRWPDKSERRAIERSKMKRSRMGLSLGRVMDMSPGRSDVMEKIKPNRQESQIEGLRQQYKQLRENLKQIVVEKYSEKMSELSNKRKQLEDLQEEYMKNSVKIAQLQSTRSQIQHRLYNIIKTDLKISQILNLGPEKKFSNHEVQMVNVLKAVRQALCRGEDRQTIRILLSNF